MPASGGSPPRKRPRSLSGQFPARAVSRQRLNYPKKRVSVACDICRSRKSRCDGARPACSFCAEIGVPCVYRKLDLPERTNDEHLPENPEHRLFHRLDRIEELLLDVKAQTSSSANSNVSAERPTMSGPSPHAITASTKQPSASGVVVGFDLHNLSSVGQQSCHPALLPLFADDFEERLESELLEGETLFQGPPVLLDTLDLTPRRCWQLQQAFLKHMLPWRPILDQQVCAQLVNRIVEEKFVLGGLETSLTLFVLALGSVAQDSHDTRHDATTLPGLGYFRVGCQLVDGARAFNNTLLFVQCQILMSYYLICCIRPVQAFESIRIASDKIVMLLQLRSRLVANRTYSDLCSRAYWACYLTEYELQPYIAYSSNFLQDLHESVPLPTSDYDEPGLYSFLSEIAMRRIVSRGLNGISWNRTMVLEDAVRREIILQLSQWQENLPSPIKFTLEDLSSSTGSDLGLLLDPQKISLRASFYSLRAILLWPNVVRLLGAQSNETARDGSEASRKYSQMVQDAADSLQCSVMYIYSLEPLAQSRNLMIAPSSVTLYATMLMLLCTYNEQALEKVQHKKTVEALWVGWSCIKLWASKPAFKGGLDKVERLLTAKGIGIPTGRGY